MKRRNILQATAAGMGAGMAPWAFSQGSSAMLKPGKPSAGTEVNLLTVVAPQFKAHEAKLAEFEALTGIKVKYQYVPFASTREKLTAELVGQSAQYDVLSTMDVWGPSMYQLFEPLNAMLAEKKIDMESRYPYAHLRAARDGKSLPDGSLLVLEQHAARLGSDGKPATGSDGFYVAEKFVAYAVMERGNGWGKEIPENLRNEDWHYAAYSPDRQLRPANQAECLACHKPLDKDSYLFSIKALTETAKKR